jgi:hypothetical protein
MRIPDARVIYAEPFLSDLYDATCDGEATEAGMPLELSIQSVTLEEP